MPWGQIHINLIIKFPEEDRYSIVMTCIDFFSRLAVLVLLRKSDIYTAAKKILAEAVSHHGLTLATIGSKDPRFQGNFWEKLTEYPNTSLSFGTASHP